MDGYRKLAAVKDLLTYTFIKQSAGDNALRFSLDELQDKEHRIKRNGTAWNAKNTMSSRVEDKLQ